MYRLIRTLLFRLDAETSHRLSLSLMHVLFRVPGARLVVRALYARRVPALPLTVMGLAFRNPVGLAAGLDKNACHAPMLSDFGFGFVEVGTVTPRPQPGNPKPRLFRLPAQHAIINRMGFNNAGVAMFLNNLYRGQRLCPVGANIGRNKDTPNERAVEDYVSALRAVYPHADYVAVNISSPNTAGLRDLQEGDNLETLLHTLKQEQQALAGQHERYVPIALKIAPDLDDGQIAVIAHQVLAHGFDAVIATNTTVTRPGLDAEPLAQEAGGLSGAPLRALSTEVIRKLYAHLRGRVPIIGVGGIETAADAWEKLMAGADAIQVYTGFIYHGPAIVREIVTGLARYVRERDCTTLADALARARAGH